MPGTNRTVIGDADSLIALVNKEDSNHRRAKKIVQKLAEKEYTIVYPNTAILEAITALTRKLDLRDRAELIVKQSLIGGLSVVWVDDEVQRKALKFFVDKATSKQNTIFDCVVMALAGNISADGIFSFDKWYSKLGFKLAHELI